MLKTLIFSDRAMTALKVETLEKIQTETGGVFLGYRKGSVWYVIETVDPGPSSIFQAAYFEYDQNYINHLINKISRLYNEQLDLIGLWHRHPGSYDKFSSTDDLTNSKYAELNSDGAVSLLVNIDPVFRITPYHVTLPLSYEKIEYKVGDDLIPPSILLLKDHKMLETRINDICSKSSISTYTKRIDVIAAKVTMEDAIRAFLSKRHISNMKNRRLSSTEHWNDNDWDYMLTALEMDLSFLESISTACSLKIDSASNLVLCNSENENSTVVFSLAGKKVLFNIDGQTYIYYSGLVKDAYEEYLKG